jgi:hypothetical protein
MRISPCPADRTRALARLRKGRADHVRRKSAHLVEVKMSCGCVVEVDFNDPILTSALEKSLKARSN